MVSIAHLNWDISFLVILEFFSRKDVCNAFHFLNDNAIEVSELAHLGSNWISRGFMYM